MTSTKDDRCPHCGSYTAPASLYLLAKLFKVIQCSKRKLLREGQQDLAIALMQASRFLMTGKVK